MRDGEERSDEWKVVRYVRRRYNAFAVASLQPLLIANPFLVASLLAATLDLETRIEDECNRYQEALWEEVDPVTADKLRQADEDVKNRADLVIKARGGIEEERENQENMQRDFRNTLGGNKNMQHAYHR